LAHAGEMTKKSEKTEKQRKKDEKRRHYVNPLGGLVKGVRLRGGQKRNEVRKKEEKKMI